MRTHSLTEKICISSVLVAMGIALQIIESMIPMPINIPGGKLGLANIVTLIILYLFDFKCALLCAAMRSFIGSFLYSGIGSAIYSVSGALFAACMMALFKKIFKCSVSEVGISIIGAVSHNIAQVTVASVVLSSAYVFSYIPVLSIAACITGIFTGYGAKAALVYMKKIKKTDR